MADVVVSVGTRTKKVEVTVLMSFTRALCLLVPLLSLVLHKADLFPHILFPDHFIALALRGREPKPDHPILPPPPTPSPADSPHFETYRLGRKLIAIGDCRPPSPPPLILDCNKAPPSNPPPPPPPPPSPADSPHFETYRLGRKLIEIGDCHPPSPPPLLLDCYKAPASNPPLPHPPPPSPADSPHIETFRLGKNLIAMGDCHPPFPPPLILDCNKAPPSNPPPPPPPPSPADSPHFETYSLGRKLIDIGDCHPPSPPPLILDCNKAPASNPPPPPPPPSPADSPHFETYHLGRKLIAIGDSYLPYPPPLMVDCNKAPASNPPPPPPPPPSPTDSPHFETYRLGRKLIATGDSYLPYPPPLIVDYNYMAGEYFQVNIGLLQVVLQGKAFSFAEWQASTDIFVGFQRRST